MEIRINEAVMLVEEEAFIGVKKIAKKVIDDIELVTDKKIEFVTDMSQNLEAKPVIIAGTIGKSNLLEELVDTKSIEGKREVYIFKVTEYNNKPALVIAGSDKRGTIYGLFHLSELMEVSPWVYFADVKPGKKAEVIISEKDNLVSKEPSVKYRGIFINDEWPSFGNWTFRHFGGFTSEMYDHVFELILRLKGNYLWPAMWTSNFSLDGPGFSNATLADEYGIVMSNSHHEPCLRHSEEWDKVKGKDTPYGTAWNFDQNKEGLTNYWRDGLKRNGKLDNIITMGMRGERDSEILGHTATLKDNIDYLKEVILTQNKLIKEEINENLDEVPRMLALYKEVEAYFYGDENTPGLRDWKELDGITFMLCEDNFGNMRTLPTADIKDRKGGWGMYYHFDYHGDPISYEWVNSTYLPKVWEQMSMAYDFGIRDIWIVNTGDLKPQELPISYFLDLAYDFEKYGTASKNNTVEYTKAWVKQQFGSIMSEEDLEKTFYIIENYTRQNHIRKPETMHLDIYDAVNYGEADKLIALAKECIDIAEYLYLKYEDQASFYQLVYYPVVASFNLDLMWMYSGKNTLYSKQGKLAANQYANLVQDCIVLDRELQKEYHKLENGKWDGMMMSEHIGFTHWNDEECMYPVKCYVEPSNNPRLVVNADKHKSSTMGGDWTRRPIIVYDFMDPKCDTAVIKLATTAIKNVAFNISKENAEWLVIEELNGTVKLEKDIVLKVDRSKIKNEVESGSFRIDFERYHVDVKVFAAKTPDNYDAKKYVPVLPEELTKMIPLTEDQLGLSINVQDFISKEDSKEGSFEVLVPFGKYESGVKAFPTTKTFVPGVDAPSLSYEFVCPKAGEYEIKLIFAPSNPISVENKLGLGVSLNGEKPERISLIKDDYVAGTVRCKEWADAVLDNEHIVTIKRNAHKGTNTITVYACDPAVVLERIVIRDGSRTWEKGFIGCYS